MKETSNGKMVKACFKVSILFKLDILTNVSLPIMPNWLSRTIPMSKYFSGSRPLRHNEVQLYIYTPTINPLLVINLVWSNVISKS